MSMSGDPAEAARGFAVLNPGGRDATQVFADGAGKPGDPGHAPINYHAYAACMRGGFYRDVREVPEGVRAVLVLLRKRHLGDALDAVRKLKARGVRALVSWKESGLHQVTDALDEADRVTKFREVCVEADGFVSSTPDLVDLYRSAGCKAGAFVPTPYPVDVSAWNFSKSVAERQGIFIGTREFDVPSRNHLLAVSLASATGQFVTVINCDGRKGEKLLKAAGKYLNIIPGPIPYVDYLRLMATHRVVFQQDRSAVPGQVAGDALLCRIPCVGGDGAIDRVAFPELSGAREDVVGLLKELCEDEERYEQAVAKSQAAAMERVSFAAVGKLLGEMAG